MIVFFVFDFTNFIGRFHPLLVHLPIGFLLLGILMEWYQRIRKTKKLSNLISYAWLLGGIGGALAAFCGWWLGETGLYFENDLFLHRWIGIAIVIISFIGWWLKKKPEQHANVIHQTTNFLILGLVLFEGHLGGNLTHGSDYLYEYAPEWIRNMMMPEKDEMTDLSKNETVFIYEDLVQPIFVRKCFACHNNEVQRGGLNMISIDSMLIDSSKDPIFLGGNTEESELFRRITLPQRNVKFMPPVGDPLTYDEIKIVEWWIAQGASANTKVGDTDLPESLKPAILRQYGLDANPKPYYEMVNISPLDSTVIRTIEQNGFTVKSLGDDNPLIDIKFTGSKLTLEQLKSLEQAAAHITWLSVARTNITDDWLTIISSFENLTRLQLEKTAITDQGIRIITNLKHLEALNLYGTNITDSSLEDIKKIEGLQRVYLWGTKVSNQAAKELEENKEDLQVIIGEG